MHREEFLKLECAYISLGGSCYIKSLIQHISGAAWESEFLNKPPGDAIAAFLGPQFK